MHNRDEADSVNGHFAAAVGGHIIRAGVNCGSTDILQGGGGGRQDGDRFTPYPVPAKGDFHWA